MRQFLVLAAVLFFSLWGDRSWGQDLPSDVQAWNAITVLGPVEKSQKLLFWFDGHARFNDDASDIGTTIIRPALGWQANDWLQLFLGYARVTSHSASPDIQEDRIWQQAMYPLPAVAGGTLGGRTRLEQRFRGQGEGTGWRLRQFVRWGRPLRDSAFSAVVWDELFLNFNDTDWGQSSGFDQNRLFVGGAYQTSAGTRLEAGYLNNILNVPGQGTRVNHNISLAFFVSL